MIYTSAYTSKTIDAAVGCLLDEPGFMEVLALISVASTKGYTLTYSSTGVIKVAIIDDTNAVVAGIDDSLKYIGVDFSDAITFINNLTNN